MKQKFIIISLTCCAIILIVDVLEYNIQSTLYKYNNASSVVLVLVSNTNASSFVNSAKDINIIILLL